MCSCALNSDSVINVQDLRLLVVTAMLLLAEKETFCVVVDSVGV